MPCFCGVVFEGFSLFCFNGMRGKKSGLYETERLRRKPRDEDEEDSNFRGQFLLWIYNSGVSTAVLGRSLEGNVWELK